MLAMMHRPADYQLAYKRGDFRDVRDHLRSGSNAVKSRTAGYSRENTLSARCELLENVRAKNPRTAGVSPPPTPMARPRRFRNGSGVTPSADSGGKETL